MGREQIGLPSPSTDFQQFQGDAGDQATLSVDGETFGKGMTTNATTWVCVNRAQRIKSTEKDGAPGPVMSRPRVV